jgi:predicted TIM-barrel fold metal-dependent hydrolase
MIIDAHTHVYPDKIALKVAESARAHLGEAVPFIGDFTLADLKNVLKGCGIDAAITFCVAEKPKIVRSANDFLIEATDNKTIFGFGTIHPDMEEPVTEVRRLREKGLKGIKFHSLFQLAGAADERLLPIYEEMEKTGMIAYFHVGRDPGDPSSPSLTTPQSISFVRDQFPRLKIVAAHFGGLFELEEAAKWVYGKDIFIDTCWSPNVQALNPREVTEIIKRHGADKILFASDYPTTTDIAVQMEWLKNLPLEQEEQELIFGGNARKLLAV